MTRRKPATYGDDTPWPEPPPPPPTCEHTVTYFTHTGGYWHKQEGRLPVREIEVCSSCGATVRYVR